MKIIFKIAILFLLFSCSKDEGIAEKASFPVEVTKSVKKDMPIFLDSIGHIKPLISVNVRARVEGELKKVHFKEGDEVKIDQPLFTIDPRPYEADLKKAEGVLEQNIAALAIAKDRLKRNEKLVKDDYISQIDFDQLKANVERADGLVKESLGEVEKARLNVEYCHITSPIDGITSILQKDRGNLIIIDDTEPIVSINQITPIYVIFSIPEIDLPDVMSQGKNLNLKIAYNDIKEPITVGKFELIDNTVDKDTGTIKLRALFENKDKKLWPGQFVKTRLELYIQKDAIVIPYQSIQFTIEGPIVYAVKSDQTVEIRKIILGPKEDEEIIIKSGIAENETLVLKGQINLFPGASIAVKETPK